MKAYLRGVVWIFSRSLYIYTMYRRLLMRLRARAANMVGGGGCVWCLCPWCAVILCGPVCVCVCVCVCNYFVDGVALYVVPVPK